MFQARLNAISKDPGPEDQVLCDEIKF